MLTMSQLYDGEYSHDERDSLDAAMPVTVTYRESARSAEKKPYRPAIGDDNAKPHMPQMPIAECISAGRRTAIAAAMYTTEGQIDLMVHQHLQNLMTMMSDTQAQQAELLAEQRVQRTDVNGADYHINSLQQSSIQLTCQLARLQDGMASMMTALTALNTWMATSIHSEWRSHKQVGNTLRSTDLNEFSAPAQPIAVDQMPTTYRDAAHSESSIPYRAITLIDAD
ncbi:hypothetical protein COEREDRAFT_11691 [Coemansia reversa NRRL 1564]|uniref:Uncharacterized protein n=1 Tax=Coemansia reversa (strain ATCC 12441 / NRRL 1564) TaxID=763665 RepID=A0A2G5B2G9_COERN|nr:hypothetical protein COEREDRAFT_11691 [Coemansia reversa NRRL 1564]|eukprot:PIA13194.1 hypothetical protein COEREDRAFT_11691 [Coemansia reversa NRRL 1564]